MSFIDILRDSRSSKTSVLHQFLTNYDPSSSKYYIFVEGDPDRTFYRSKLERRISVTEKLIIYNCEGKRNVYAAFEDIRRRYPKIDRALFFVDKDVDDIIGKSWPTDPRIFTTDVYSIENYIVVRQSLDRYLAEHIKAKHITMDTSAIAVKFAYEQPRFHLFITPIMAWIVAMRRSGHSVNLANVNLAELFEIRDGSVVKKKGRRTLNYLSKVTQASGKCDWRLLRQTVRELKRFEPKSFVRGKFEAWWFVAFINHSCQALTAVAREAGGTVSQTIPLTNSNLIHLLSEVCPTVPALDSFADFHFKTQLSRPIAREKTSLLSRLWPFR